MSLCLDLLINKVLPAIRSKWPEGESHRPIFIQQDNAKPYISTTNAAFVREASKDGFHITLTCQPPNSPDMNVLDLGFFNAIQSLQHTHAPTSIDELIHVVNQSFFDISAESLNKVFLTWQSCMIETLRLNGANTYKLSHIKKQMLRNTGSLSVTISLPDDVINQYFV